MKKVFTLFAAALLGLCAFAQEGPCPSRLYFEPAADEQPANNATFLLKLVNSSENLNGFNMEVQKPEAAVWVEDADDEDWVDSLAMATLSLQDGKALPTASASNSSLRRPT